jgi:hypothetical protein
LVWISCSADGCDNGFEARGKKKFCSRDCQNNTARASQRVDHNPQFVSVDGEGENINGRHEYVLLSVGSESLHNHGAPLHWWEVFEFLWSRFEENPEATYVGFFLGYDFTQWLKSIPEDRARMLMTKEGKAIRERTASGDNRTPFPVYLMDWEFDLLGHKRFKLRKSGEKGWMYICDCGPFYQTSFVNAINPSKSNDPIVTAEEYDIIIEGKANRSAATFGPEMIRYNLLENEILARLMGQLNRGFVAADIRLNRKEWMGPGQAAQKWMRNVGCPTGDEIREKVPENARDWARYSYYGGWFEIFAHGHIPGRSYGYDINSAYPYIISKLPCLLHGQWRSGVGSRAFSVRKDYTLVYATVEGNDNQCGAMMHREKNGSIHRPSKTKGWYWYDELAMGMRAGVIDTVDVHEWVEYSPCDCPPPLADIERMYQQRLSIGKNTPAGIAYKLIYNSAYGKLAQSVGKPKFSNPIWASLITSGCRRMILEAIATHPTGTRDLLMVATDGVYFRTPHDSLPLSGNTLGMWEEETKDNLTLFLPGMYWDDKTRASIQAGKAPILRSRGVSAGDLGQSIAAIDAQYNQWTERKVFPSAEVAVKFNMVSMGQALNRNRWDLCGTVVEGGMRKLDSDPKSKRWALMLEREGDIIRSGPYYMGRQLQTVPYDRRFGDELRDRQDNEAILTPDGDGQALFRQAILES